MAGSKASLAGDDLVLAWLRGMRARQDRHLLPGIAQALGQRRDLGLADIEAIGVAAGMDQPWVELGDGIRHIYGASQRLTVIHKRFHDPVEFGRCCGHCRGFGLVARVFHAGLAGRVVV